MNKCPEPCRDKGNKAEHGKCQGIVAMRPSLTGSGTLRARCERHWALRLQRVCNN